MLSQTRDTMTFKFALWILNQSYKFSSLIILNPFIPRNVKRLLQTWKNRRNADPTPFFLTCHYKFNQSINQIFPSKREEAIVFFLNCLRTPLFKKSFKSAQMWSHHNVYWLANTVQFPAPLHMLLAIDETLFCTSKDGERKSTHNLDLRQMTYTYSFLNKNNSLCKREWIQHTLIQHTY